MSPDHSAPFDHSERSDRPEQSDSSRRSAPSSAYDSELIDRLAEAHAVAVLTGAGISAESGIPTFRDEDGLWQKYDPSELATMEAFLDRPDVVQDWYAHRRSILEEAGPNPAHRALTRLEELVPEFLCVTQNVDDLHREADTEAVVELHGNIRRSYCVDCEEPADEEVLARIEEGAPARCPECGGLIRPDVVWFGEALPRKAIARAERAARSADVFLSVGTSAAVHPAAGLPVTAHRHGAYLVEVNVDRTEITAHADEVLRGPAGEELPQLVSAIAETTARDAPDDRPDPPA